MVDLACVYPVPTIRVACEAFADTTRSVDDRVKYGEVLSKLVEQCDKDILRPYVRVMVEGLLRMLNLDIAATVSSKAGDQVRYIIHRRSGLASLLFFLLPLRGGGEGRGGERRGVGGNRANPVIYN